MFVFKGFGSRCPLCVCRTFSYAMRYSRTIRRILRIICLWFMSEGVPIGTAMVHHLVATDLWSAGSPDHCFTICVILADLQLSPGRVCALLRTFAATMTINCRRCLMAFPTCQNFSQVVEDHDTLSSTLSLDFGSVLAPMEHTPLSGQGDSGGHAYDMFFHEPPSISKPGHRNLSRCTSLTYVRQPFMQSVIRTRTVKALQSRLVYDRFADGRLRTMVYCLVWLLERVTLANCGRILGFVPILEKPGTFHP